MNFHTAVTFRRTRWYPPFLCWSGLCLLHGCAPKSDEGGRRANEKAALVASGQPHNGRAFVVGALLSFEAAQDMELRAAMQQAAQDNHLTLDIQTAQSDASAQAAQVDTWRDSQADALVVCFSAEAEMQPALQRAADAQIAVVAADMSVVRPDNVRLVNTPPIVVRVAYHLPPVSKPLTRDPADLRASGFARKSTKPPAKPLVTKSAEMAAKPHLPGTAAPISKPMREPPARYSSAAFGKTIITTAAAYVRGAKPKLTVWVEPVPLP